MSDQQPLRFGICGLGFMGRTHFAHLRQHPRAQVTAVCDRNPQLRSGQWGAPTGNMGNVPEQTADLTGVTTYADPAELIADPQVDVVAVTLPTPCHADVSEAALRGGKHVFCEKPMALDLAGCDRMLRAAEESGRTLMVAQCVRFWPQYEVIYDLIAEGHIGPVRFARLARLASPPLYSSDNWLMQGPQSGGGLLDLHVHDVDFVQHLLGLPATVFAHGRYGPSGGVDHVLATYAYNDGAYACIEGGWTYHAPWPFEMAITVQGEQGTLDWSSLRGELVRWYHGGKEMHALPCPSGTGWTREMDYFVACVERGEPVSRCLPASSRASIALALLERQSIETGQPQRVDARAAGRE
ncbi:MAG: Gfo/Idh/MocA family oxidoreductase [Phycisphaerae bacterium]|jgi:predicted dehydrogenase